MADWYTPAQVQKALETQWMKIENTTTPLKVSYRLTIYIKIIQYRQ